MSAITSLLIQFPGQRPVTMLTRDVALTTAMVRGAKGSVLSAERNDSLAAYNELRRQEALDLLHSLDATPRVARGLWQRPLPTERPNLHLIARDPVPPLGKRPEAVATDQIWQYLLDNISPADARPGAVVAATSRDHPPYYFHWVRDAGLVMMLVAEQWGRLDASPRKQELFKILQDFTAFTKLNQQTPALTGFGEPKFNIDGSPYMGAWGRPQNDGPAIRALALMRLANGLLDQGDEGWVRAHLYHDAEFSDTVIKQDLNYVAQNWRQPCFDLWEEVKGGHFYTLMVQRRALLAGVKLAERLHDPEAVQYYGAQAVLIAAEIGQFWDAGRGIIQTTRHRIEGVDNKHSGLDLAVILGVLHARGEDSFFAPTDDRVLATAFQLIQAFHRLYPINHQGLPAVAMGRYPEDLYYGGNPWVLTTLSMAELLHLAAQGFSRSGEIRISEHNRPFFRFVLSRSHPDEPGVVPLNVGDVYKKSEAHFSVLLKALAKVGDDFIDRIHHHDYTDGRLSEQIDRDTGYMGSAENLTWNYAAYLTAMRSRSTG